MRRPHFTRRRLWLLAGLLPAVVIIAILVGGSERVPQPVAFNHARHAGEFQLPCTFCHPYVETGAHAGLPDAKICAGCHQQAQGTSPEAARVTELIAEGAPLRFNKLFRMEPHVFYTHRRHVGIAKLECEICHGPVAETERPPTRALVKVTMDFCMDCHRERQETLDCNACHR